MNASSDPWCLSIIYTLSILWMQCPCLKAKLFHLEFGKNAVKIQCDIHNMEYIWKKNQDSYNKLLICESTALHLLMWVTWFSYFIAKNKQTNKKKMLYGPYEK